MRRRLPGSNTKVSIDSGLEPAYLWCVHVCEPSTSSPPDAHVSCRIRWSIRSGPTSCRSDDKMQRMRRIASVGTLVLWLVSVGSRAFALNPALDVSQYVHTAWKIRDG